MLRLKLRATFLAITTFLSIALIQASACSACPTCKAAISGEGDHNIQTGFYWSILFMMAMPFILLLSMSTLMYLSIRRAKRDQQSVATASAISCVQDQSPATS